MVIDADRVGHRVLEPDGAAYEDVVARWPETLVDSRIDRSALASVVFTNPEELERLESITHPRIRAEIEGIVEEIANDVAVEVPLLRDWFPHWPVVVVVASLTTRRARLLGRGMTPLDIGRRLAAQPDEDTWRAAADFVIHNDGTAADLDPQLDELDRFLDDFFVGGSR